MDEPHKIIGKIGDTNLVWPVRTKTIKLEVRTWDKLKGMKKENETFNDVVKDLLDERTKAVGNEDVKAIKYKRKTGFFQSTKYADLHKTVIGVEYDYNDIKGNKIDFNIDLKIKRIFFGKKAYNPSEFFGVDNEHKHYSYLFMAIYLSAVAEILSKEFRISMRTADAHSNIIFWRQLYHDYNLSEESFNLDIEDPLRLSEEEKPSKTWEKRIAESIAAKEYPITVYKP